MNTSALLELFAALLLAILLIFYIIYLFNKIKVDACVSRYSWLIAVVLFVLGFLLNATVAVLSWFVVKDMEWYDLWFTRISSTFGAFISLSLAIKYYKERNKPLQQKSPGVELPLDF